MSEKKSGEWTVLIIDPSAIEHRKAIAFELQEMAKAGNVIFKQMVLLDREQIVVFLEGASRESSQLRPEQVISRLIGKPLVYLLVHGPEAFQKTNSFAEKGRERFGTNAFLCPESKEQAAQWISLFVPALPTVA